MTDQLEHPSDCTSATLLNKLRDQVIVRFVKEHPDIDIKWMNLTPVPADSRVLPTSITACVQSQPMVFKDAVPIGFGTLNVSRNDGTEVFTNLYVFSPVRESPSLPTMVISQRCAESVQPGEKPSYTLAIHTSVGEVTLGSRTEKFDWSLACFIGLAYLQAFPGELGRLPPLTTKLEVISQSAGAMWTQAMTQYWQREPKASPDQAKSVTNVTSVETPRSPAPSGCMVALLLYATIAVGLAIAAVETLR